MVYCKESKKILLNTMQKFSPESSLPLPRHRQKIEMISLSFDVTDNIYSRSKT